MTVDLRARLLRQTPEIPSVPSWQTATVLVTVKAYPAMASKSGESVCVAGIRIDQEYPQWIRLFPVGFRRLPAAKQFEKYQVVRLRVKRGTTDQRPESFKPDLDSLTLGPRLDTARDWSDRRELLDPVLGETTTCSLLTESRVKGQSARSLGLVKPASVTGLDVAENPDYDPAKAATTDIDLFGQELSPLSASPVIAHYRYTCAEPTCRGHRQMLVDWESGQLARRNAHLGLAAMSTRHQTRFIDEMCGSSRDPYFFIGNQHQHPAGYLVLGVFWPPKTLGWQAPFEFDDEF